MIHDYPLHPTPEDAPREPPSPHGCAPLSNRDSPSLASPTPAPRGRKADPGEVTRGRTGSDHVVGSSLALRPGHGMADRVGSSGVDGRSPITTGPGTPKGPGSGAFEDGAPPGVRVHDMVGTCPATSLTPAIRRWCMSLAELVIVSVEVEGRSKARSPATTGSPATGSTSWSDGTRRRARPPSRRAHDGPLEPAAIGLDLEDRIVRLRKDLDQGGGWTPARRPSAATCRAGLGAGRRSRRSGGS